MGSTFDSTALAGKAGIVTGAASGIGKATVHALSAAGAEVLGADRDLAGCEQTASLAPGPGRVDAVFVDVADEESVESMVADAVDRFGRLDFAHNNAGIVFTGRRMHAVTREEWDRLIGIDLTGVFLCMKSEIKAMLGTEGGSIVNSASVVGMIGMPRQSPYVAAKHGVIGLTRAAALEYAEHGIRVNAVCPGAIETRLFEEAARTDPALRGAVVAGHPLGRLGTPEEIADAVVWLVSGASSFMTGQPILVDGGYTAQ
jgi:NAD(P)-dependent dehydrogenase (short-subunit alcohol dehydrogenase family)